MKRIDRTVGFIMIMLSVCVIYTSHFFRASEGIGPGFFPQMVSYVLILLSSLLIAGEWRNPKQNSQSRTFTKHIMTGIGSTIGYIILIYFAGFYLSTIIFLLAFMWIYQFRKVIPLFLVSGLVTLAIYIIFDMVLHVPLPSGFIFSLLGMEG